MNDSHRTRSVGDVILLVATCVGILAIAFLTFQRGSWTIGALTASSASLGPHVVQWRDMDRKALELASGTSGNIVADLHPPTDATDHQREYIATFYSRSVFTLWPRRIYITYPSIVINFASQIAAAPLPADRTWMAQHNVTAVVRVNLNSD